MAESSLYGFEEYALCLGCYLGQGKRQYPQEVRKHDGSQEFWRRWASFLTGENLKTAFGKYRKFTESLRAALTLAFQHYNIPGSPMT